MHTDELRVNPNITEKETKFQKKINNMKRKHIQKRI